MLKMSAQRGDVIHVVFSDGQNGMIMIQSRSELAFHFPQSVRVSREKRQAKNLINRNQK
ncbi:hypothetical protein BrE312_2728 [Brenneria sp. EniD312]|nr:hypothetical protein BrE312_2728 [Brenneria sp. EniD312]